MSGEADHRGRLAFDAAATRGVLRSACRQVGFGSEGAQLLRLGENAIYRLAHEPIVVRIARTMDYWRDVKNEVMVARWLARGDFPVAIACDLPQPIVSDGHPVTFWRYIDGRPGGREDIGTLARLLQRLHAMPAPQDFELAPTAVLGRMVPRIEAAQVSVEDKELLLGCWRRLGHELPLLNFPLPPGPIHGDAHTENLMVSDGGAFLIDFERFSWGQPEWDLSVMATEYVSAGWWTDAEYHVFVDTYGYDVMDWAGFELLRLTHEMKMTTWLMQNVSMSVEVAAEYEVRMHTIRTGRTDLPWRPF